MMTLLFLSMSLKLLFLDLVLVLLLTCLRPHKYLFICQGFLVLNPCVEGTDGVFSEAKLDKKF